jgi:hypothetical protein
MLDNLLNSPYAYHIAGTLIILGIILIATANRRPTSQYHYHASVSEDDPLGIKPFLDKRKR